MDVADPARRRTAPIKISNSSNVRLENCVAHGFDDFAHIENSRDVSAINCEHYPSADSIPPSTDDFSNTRREPQYNDNKTASSKSFSLPPRKRTTTQRSAEVEIARYLPAICESSMCATLFPSTFRLETVVNFRVEGQRGGRCPKCGTPGRIISGSYDCEHAELIISSLDHEASSFFEKLLAECEKLSVENERTSIFWSRIEETDLDSIREVMNLFGDPRLTGVFTIVGGICGFLSLMVTLAKSG